MAETAPFICDCAKPSLNQSKSFYLARTLFIER
jgi:hypothetical protein